MSALRRSSDRPHDGRQSNHVVDQGGTLSRIDRGTDAKVDQARTRASSHSRRTTSLRRLAAGSSRRNIVFLALLFVLGASAAAIAAPGGTIMTSADIPANPGTPGLDRVGPVGDNGFPDWYRDGSGV